MRVGLTSVRKQPAFSANIGYRGDHRERRHRETPSKRLNGHDEQSEPAADRVLPSLYLLIGALLAAAVRVAWLALTVLALFQRLFLCDEYLATNMHSRLPSR